MSISSLGLIDLMQVTLGARIKDARERRGWSQYALARLADVTPPAISRIEAGKAEPSLDSASKIARALGLTTSELLGERETQILAEPPEVALARRAADSLMALKIDEPVRFLAALASLSAGDQEFVADLVYARAARLRSSGIKPPRILGSAPEGDK